MSFGPLDDLARRPDATVLVVHVPDDLDGAAQIAEARAKYLDMVVVSLKGQQAQASALQGRDVVLWPWRALPGSRAQLEPFEAALSRSASRLRVIVPKSPDDYLGPADLNGHDPIGWARAQCLVIPPREAVDLEKEWFGGDEPEPGERLNGAPALLEETHERVSEWVPPQMLEGEQPDPVDLFERPAIPGLDRAMLPPSLAAFVFDQSQIIGSDPCILAISTLVACAALTSDAIRLQPKQYEVGWKESARLWGAFVGDPSVKKTPPLNRAISHLRKIDADFAEESDEAMRRYKIARKIYEKAEAKWIDDQSKNRPCGPLQDPPERPPMRRVLVQDATIEAVADVLADNPEGVLVLFDELSGFFGSMDAYRAQAGKDRSFWLESYNGGQRRVDRISREARSVPNLSTCILGGIQPAAIREKAKGMVEDGLLQRFMIVIASGGHSMGEDRRQDTEAHALYRGILDALVASRGDPEKPLVFEPAARAILNRVEVKLDEMTRAERLPLRMRYQIGKWSGLFARLCLTYHAIECAAVGLPIEGEVAADLAERVELLMFGFLFWHLQYFYEVVLGDSTGEVELAQLVAKWILAAAPDRFTSSQVSKGVTAWRGSTWNMRRAVLDRLENCGWVTRAPRDYAAGAHTAWLVNPKTRAEFGHLVAEEQQRRERARARLTGEDE